MTRTLLGMESHATSPRPSAEDSDADVIAQVVAGDRESFATLVRRYNQTMFRACRAILGNDQDAEDAVQVAWINVYRALATFRSDASLRTWITCIAVNEASSRLRHRRRFSEVPIEEVMMQDSGGPEGAAITEELGRVLEREIAALPEGMRAVIVLRDVIELDTAETALCLGIDEQNVRVRLHRARQAVAARMGGDSNLTEVWRFDGERCARVLAHVMAKLAAM